jgi:TPR repeat protein
MVVPRYAAALLLLACASCAAERQPPSASSQTCLDPAACEQNCAMGIGASCRVLARQHELGIGTQVDLRKAVRLYQRGCGAGDTRSCVSAANYLRDAHPAVAEPLR